MDEMTVRQEAKMMIGRLWYQHMEPGATSKDAPKYQSALALNVG